MKIGLRIFLGYFVIVALAALLLARVFVAEVKPGVRQAMEDTLVDTANVLAELATDDFRAGHINDWSKTNPPSRTPSCTRCARKVSRSRTAWQAARPCAVRALNRSTWPSSTWACPTSAVSRCAANCGGWRRKPEATCR